MVFLFYKNKKAVQPILLGIPLDRKYVLISR